MGKPTPSVASLSDVDLWQKVTRAKSDVQQFASQIVQWVTEMTAAFEDGRVRRYSRRTKKNLEKRRHVDLANAHTDLCAEIRLSALIHEICAWAAARLVRLVY
jgi:hypothetical protein